MSYRSPLPRAKDDHTRKLLIVGIEGTDLLMRVNDGMNYLGTATYRKNRVYHTEVAECTGSIEAEIIWREWRRDLIDGNIDLTGRRPLPQSLAKQFHTIATATSDFLTSVDPDPQRAIKMILAEPGGKETLTIDLQTGHAPTYDMGAKETASTPEPEPEAEAPKKKAKRKKSKAPAPTEAETTPAPELPEAQPSDETQPAPIDEPDVPTTPTAPAEAPVPPADSVSPVTSAYVLMVDENQAHVPIMTFTDRVRATDVMESLAIVEGYRQNPSSAYDIYEVPLKITPQTLDLMHVPHDMPEDEDVQKKTLWYGSAVSYETLHYRARFHLRTTTDDASVLDVVRRATATWFDEHKVDQSVIKRILDDETTNLEEVSDGRTVTLRRITTDTADDWVLELRENDMSFRQRLWHTVIALHVLEDDAILNVIVTYYQLPGTFGRVLPPRASIPRIVRGLLNDHDIHCSSSLNPIQTTVETIADRKNLTKVIRDITEPMRELPIIISTLERKFDLKRLMQTTLGMTEFYQVDLTAMSGSDVVTTFTDCGLENNPVHANAINIYLPGIDAAGRHDGSRHYVYTARQLRSLDAETVITEIRRGLLDVPEAACVEPVSATDITALETREHTAHLKHRLDTLKRDIEQHQEESPDETSLADDLAVMTGLAEEYSANLDQETKRADAAEQRVYTLTTKVNALQRALNATDTTVAPTLDIPKLPTSTTDLLELAEELWPQRIAIHEDAYRSAKDYDGPLDEQWDIIRSCATVLWPLVFEQHDPVYNQTYQNETGYVFAINESKETRDQNTYMRLRTHEIDGEQVTVCMHIKGRNTRTFFRLYPYIDNANRRIIIVYAGEHLPTAGTRRKS